MRNSFSIIGEPVGAVRQTRADRWKQRPCVIKYRDWCDKARKSAGVTKEKKINGEDYLGVFAFSHHSMPKSWSKKKRQEMQGTLHMQKPDKDNIEKAILDSLFDKDDRICLGGVCAKYWCMEDEEPRVDVFLIPFPSHIKH